jgi:hypothetical protein
VFLVVGRILDQQLEHEAIHLRFRQRVGALLLDRILGRQHHERFRQFVRLPAQRDLPLLHRLEQRALHLGGRAIDLVGEHHVGEDRSSMGLERAGLVPVDLGADQIAGQQVGRELDAAEAGAERLGQRIDHHRLGDAGNAFQQHVTVAQQRDQHLFQRLTLADDHPAHGFQDEIEFFGDGVWHDGP